MGWFSGGNADPAHEALLRQLLLGQKRTEAKLDRLLVAFDLADGAAPAATGGPHGLAEDDRATLRTG